MFREEGLAAKPGDLGQVERGVRVQKGKAVVPLVEESKLRGAGQEGRDKRPRGTRPRTPTRHVIVRRLPDGSAEGHGGKGRKNGN